MDLSRMHWAVRECSKALCLPPPGDDALSSRGIPVDIGVFHSFSISSNILPWEGVSLSRYLCVCHVCVCVCPLQHLPPLILVTRSPTNERNGRIVISFLAVFLHILLHFIAGASFRLLICSFILNAESSYAMHEGRNKKNGEITRWKTSKGRSAWKLDAEAEDRRRRLACC